MNPKFNQEPNFMKHAIFSNSFCEKGSFLSLAKIKSTTSCDRGRDPTCVVSTFIYGLHVKPAGSSVGITLYKPLSPVIDGSNL